MGKAQSPEPETENPKPKGFHRALSLQASSACRKAGHIQEACGLEFTRFYSFRFSGSWYMAISSSHLVLAPHCSCIATSHTAKLRVRLKPRSFVKHSSSGHSLHLYTSNLYLYIYIHMYIHMYIHIYISTYSYI